MTPEELDRLKAAFAAKGGTVETVAPANAYGLNAAADKAKRRAEREAADIERNAERHAEDVREGYHAGGRRGAMEAMNGRRRV
jgi:cell division septum initiation protein DivIVA